MSDKDRGFINGQTDFIRPTDGDIDREDALIEGDNGLIEGTDFIKGASDI